MLGYDDQPSSSYEQESQSRFTWRDFKNLSRYSKTCPLRTIALIDFDAFYAQCEIVRLGLPPTQPLAVQQFQFIIALNYAARAFGLKRIANPDEAKKICPDLVVQHVATWREGDPNWAYRSDVLQHLKTDKAALDPYRKESRKAFDLIKSKLPVSPCQRVEKASIDEVFLDLSLQVYELMIERFPQLSKDVSDGELDLAMPMPPTTILDWADNSLIPADVDVESRDPDWDDVALSIAAEIVHHIREDVHNTLNYTCSAGIANNKVLAKLAAGHNKPNGQTVVRGRAVTAFLSGYKFTKIRGLGGKLGHLAVTSFNTDEVSKLLDVPIDTMRAKLGASSGTWVYNVIRGIEHAEVVERTQLQSMLAAKTFVPKSPDLGHAEKWLQIFAGDLIGRLEEQEATSVHRRPRVIAVNHAIDGRFGPTRSKQMQIPLGAHIDAKLLYDLSRTLLLQISREGPTWPCLILSVCVSHFDDISTGNRLLSTYFAPKSILYDQNEQHATDQTLGNHKRKTTTNDLVKADNSLPKRSRTTNLPVTSRQITRTATPATVSATQEEYSRYLCPKCSQHIAGQDVLEHLDWHVARELQDSG